MEYAEEVKRPPAPAAAGPVLQIEKSSLAQQIEFLRSLKGTVSCDAEHVKPEPGCEALDVCRLEGPQETQKVAKKIIAGKTPTPTEVLSYFNNELKKRICFWMLAWALGSKQKSWRSQTSMVSASRISMKSMPMVCQYP